MFRRLIIILNYTAAKVFLRTTTPMSQPRTRHNYPRCRRGHPRNPLICNKDRVMEHLLYHNRTKHSTARLFKRVHIGPPRFLSLSNMELRHKSPTECLLNPHMRPPMNPPMSLHIPRRYLHLSLPNRLSTQLRPQRRRTLPTGLHTGLPMITERRATHPHTQQLRKCLWGHHTLLHMTTSVPMRMEADPAAPQATATRPNQSLWRMTCNTSVSFDGIQLVAHSQLLLLSRTQTRSMMIRIDYLLKPGHRS